MAVTPQDCSSSSFDLMIPGGSDNWSVGYERLASFITLKIKNTGTENVNIKKAL